MNTMSTRTKQMYIAAGVLILAGAIVLIVGYSGIRQQADVALQLPYVISGGLGGLFLLGAGVAVFLAGTLTELRAGQDRVETVAAELRELTQVNLELSTDIKALLDGADVEQYAPEPQEAPRARATRERARA
jgi:hypothetical protein